MCGLSSTVALAAGFGGDELQLFLLQLLALSRSPAFQMSCNAQRGAKALTFTETKSPRPAVNSGWFMPGQVAAVGQPCSSVVTVGRSGLMAAVCLPRIPC